MNQIKMIWFENAQILTKPGTSHLIARDMLSPVDRGIQRLTKSFHAGLEMDLFQF